LGWQFVGPDPQPTWTSPEVVLHPLKVKIRGTQTKEINNFTRDCFIFLLLGIVQGSFNTRKSHTPAYSSEVFSASIGKSFNLGENVSIELFIAGGKMAEGTKKSKATRHTQG